MTQPDEHIDRLISRSLDGDLSADEQLELDRALIRSPQTRRCFEESQRIDTIAAQVLRTLLSGDVATAPAAPETALSGRTSRHRKARWLVPTAAAATLAAVLMLYQGRQPTADPDRFVVVPTPTHEAASVTPPAGDRRRPVRQVSATNRPSFTDRRLNRDWIGIRGSDGNIYWLEIDRATTFERPGSGGAVKLINSDL